MAAPYSDEYTDRQKTRIYTPSSERMRYNQDDAIGQTQAIAPKEKLFDGISVPQIVAGAAAAATSVALASYIGIAGSIIGAAVSSVVTVVSSQVYRRFLTASARKIKDAAPLSGGAQAAGPSRYGRPDAAGAAETPGAAPARGARIAPSKLQARAKAEREATQRKVVAFSVVAGLLAVALCAGGIWFATAGEGLGTKVGPGAAAHSQQQEADPGNGGQEPEGAQPPADATTPQTGAGAGSDTGTSGTEGPDAGSGGGSGTGSGESGQDQNGPVDGGTDQNGSTGSAESGQGGQEGGGQGGASDGSGQGGTGTQAGTTTAA